MHVLQDRVVSKFSSRVFLDNKILNNDVMHPVDIAQPQFGGGKVLCLNGVGITHCARLLPGHHWVFKSSSKHL